MIISGSTAYYRVRFSSPPVLSMVDAIVFSFAHGGRVLLKKRYPDDTLLIDGEIVIPLSQKDTTTLCGHGFLEAQINYHSGSVAKTAVARYYVAPSAATELVNGSAPDGSVGEVTVLLELTDPAYIKGEPGVSATHSWNGTVLTVTSASGSSSADLKGDKGDTPVRGTDYWTAADQAQMVGAVIAALPTWEGGSF